MSKTKWTKENVPDQSGKTVIVTGSSSGIGFEAAKVLADKGAEVIIAVRNQQKGENALREIKRGNPKVNVVYMNLDLADLKSVKSFADEFNSRYEKLDILINNAGVMIPPYSKTTDGFELQMGTNHLGHFALTAQLFEKLKSSPAPVITNVSSAAHNYGNIDFSDLNWEKRKYKAWRAYGDSKIANLYFTYELKRRLEKAGISIKVTAAHPGWTATDLQRHSGTFSFLNRFFAMDQAQGALPTLRAACDPDTESGDYFGPDGWKEWSGYPTKVNSNRLSHDAGIAERLWKVSEELTKTNFPV